MAECHCALEQNDIYEISDDIYIYIYVIVVMCKHMRVDIMKHVFIPKRLGTQSRSALGLDWPRRMGIHASDPIHLDQWISSSNPCKGNMGSMVKVLNGNTDGAH